MACWARRASPSATPHTPLQHHTDPAPWLAAIADSATTAKYGWKLYHYTWKGAPAGEHTLVSRVTDANGHVQPTSEEPPQ